MKTNILYLGAGGAGISNILQYQLQNKNFSVIGADKIKNVATDFLENLGITIFLDNDLDIIDQIDEVFASSAIPLDHPLIKKAVLQNKKIIGRHDFFQNISNERDVIAIAGTSGKTSITSMVSHVLQGHEDCGYIIGIHGKGGHYGSTSKLVLEADEYAKTFLSLEKIDTAIISSLNYDHVDIYPSKLEYINAFKTFASRAKKLIINGDDKVLVETTLEFNPLTYGFDNTNDFYPLNIKCSGNKISFDIYFNKTKITTVSLNLIGKHHITNAIASFVANFVNNVDVDTIVQRLTSFKGAPRRIEVVRDDNILVIDDYAHLPKEVSTVINSVKYAYPERRLLTYFQPHTYKRINSLFQEYEKALNGSDILFLGDVYASRDISGSVDIIKLLENINTTHKYLSGNPQETLKLIKTQIKDNDILLVLSAGDGNYVARNI